MCGEIHTAPAQRAGAAVEEQLRADAVGGGGEEAALVERVEPGKLPEAGGPGGLDRSAQALDDDVGRGERDAGGVVRAGLLAQEGQSTSAAR